MIDGVRTGLFGASGCGKTYAAMKLLERRRETVVIIDPKLEIKPPRGMSTYWYCGTTFGDVFGAMR